MSIKTLFTVNTTTIDPVFLPAILPGDIPTLSEVLTEGNDAGGIDIINLSNLTMGLSKTLNMNGSNIIGCSGVSGFGNIQMSNGDSIGSISLVSLGLDNAYTNVQIANGNNGTIPDGHFRVNMAPYGSTVFNTYLEIENTSGNTTLCPNTGGSLYVNGTSGKGRVYDNLYNIPPDKGLVGYRQNVGLTPISGGIVPPFNAFKFAGLHTFTIPAIYQYSTRFTLSMGNITIIQTTGVLNTFTFYLLRMSDMASPNFNITNCIEAGEVLMNSSVLNVTTGIPQIVYDVPEEGAVTQSIMLVIYKSSASAGLASIDYGSFVTISGDNAYYNIVPS